MRGWLCCALAVTGVACSFRAAAAADLTSTVLARQVTAALAARQIDAWATRDPNDPDRFVAALHVPGSQLLVVSAKPTAADSLAYRLATKDYRQAYVELQTSAVASGKFFVQDLAADGLARGERGDAVDVLYEDVSTRTVLNGDWKAQKLSEAEYVRRRTAAESRYVAMLSALLSSMNGDPAAEPREAALETAGTPPR